MLTQNYYSWQYGCQRPRTTTAKYNKLGLPSLWKRGKTPLEDGQEYTSLPILPLISTKRQKVRALTCSPCGPLPRLFSSFIALLENPVMHKEAEAIILKLGTSTILSVWSKQDICWFNPCPPYQNLKVIQYSSIIQNKNFSPAKYQLISAVRWMRWQGAKPGPITRNALFSG